MPNCTISVPLLRLFSVPPANIGKFITDGFNLQWQIEDDFDVWSMDLRFYKHDVEIDNNPDTELPDNYIYHYHENLPPPPVEPDPANYIKPNGSVMVPPLTSEAGIYDDGAELKTPLTEKTTIKVVAVCYDAAGNPNEERTLGYFIYWAKANEPWVVFTDGMQSPDDFYGEKITDIEEDVFMVYPGRTIKAAAYQVNGVSKVVYSLYRCEEDGTVPDKILTNNLIPVEENISIRNEERSPGNYSTVFSWEFSPPSSSAYYVVKVTAYDASGWPGGEYASLFRVQDITFPNFPIPPSPSATDPLFMHLEDNKFAIEGEVSDATGVKSLALVWINPESRNYAAMSQLSYFRDQNYGGWLEALELEPGSSIEEYKKGNYKPFDLDHPNKLWNIPLTEKGENSDTYRMHYSYSQSISLLDDLNIGVGQQPLKSQVFLLRVENTTGKCTIITYAPQGDTLAPSNFTIDEVEISNSNNSNAVETLIPGIYKVIEKFEEEDTITINGSWAEDSTAFLNIDTYFKPNFKITVNGKDLTVNTSDIHFYKNNASSGTWTVKATVKTGNTLEPSGLKDTLVVSASVSDIGGNIAEAGASWLIESDNVKLLRVTSDSEDKLYKAGDEIEIILEFNKPVRLKNSGKPELNLNAGTGAVAVYGDGQGSNNSRQYFYYTVGAGHNTGTGNLNVTSLKDPENWQDDNYGFTWITGSEETGDSEEIRVTNVAEHDGTTRPTGTYYTKRLPVTTTASDDDYQFTLGAGKRIQIDTVSPTVTNTISPTLKGFYSTGDIYIEAAFSENAAIPDTIADADLPKLTLQVGDDVKSTSQKRDNIKVAGNKITFVYNIGVNDDSKGSAIQVTGISGTITDIAGNDLNAENFTAKTLDGIYIDTTAPGVPAVKVLSADNINNVITNTVNGGTITGASGGAEVELANVYNTALWLAIGRNGAETEAERIEYTITGDTDNPTTAPNTNNTPFTLNQKGVNKIQARQIDRAGNAGAWSQPISFNWDPGNILTRISSTSANGIYSSVNGRNTIEITLSFRKPITLGNNAALEINARRNGSNISLPIESAFSGTVLNVTYIVQNGDMLPETANKKLDVLSLTADTIRDADGVDIEQLVDVTKLTGALRLNGNKSIDVDTSALSAGTPYFTTGAVADDNSYETTLEITFNRDVFKGSGNITIEQTAQDFYLPAVITEAQYNRLRSKVSNIDTFYTKGTNGGTTNGTNANSPFIADTINKYILNYATNPNMSGAAPNADAAFFTAFRQAEKIVIPVNNQAVTVNGNKVTITLTGANAPQVPGASYTISYPATFVIDSLGNNPPADNAEGVALGGVARPFIRIKKTQDTIAIQATTNNRPRLAATQPLTAEVRMDTRTPGSEIRYTYTQYNTNINAENLNVNIIPVKAAGAGRPDDITDALTPYTIPVSIGNDNYQGMQWRVRARASKDNNNSAESEDMAYRTVITFDTGGMTAAANSGEQVLAVGDQVWIRGGDSIGASSIPGFPFTWEDNWGNLSGKRAGIRLMTKTGNNNNTLNDSEWKYVTWDMSATAYVDFVMGHDTASSADVAWQYGPRQWAYQRWGWTSYKDRYPIFPGEHRWLDVNTDNETTGKGNFSGTFSSRPNFTVSDIPGANTNE